DRAREWGDCRTTDCKPADTRSRGALKAALSPLGLEYAACHRIELLEERLVARFRRGNQRGVERAIGADRARLVLAGEIAREPGHQRLRLVSVGGKHSDDVLYGYRIVVGMPAIEVGDHGDGGVTELGLARELRF